jgi:hypothetical protein
MNARTRAKRLLTITNDWFPFKINPVAVTTEELALAGLARCRRLLDGMIQVHDAPDLAGLFARTLYETYLSSLYLALNGATACERLEANDDYELRRMAKRLLAIGDTENPVQERLRTQSEQALNAPQPSGKRIDTLALAKEVRRLLLSVDDRNAEWPVKMYSFLFAAESYTSAHGGLGAIKQYMLENGKVTDRISADPWNHAGNDHRLDLMTAAVLGLARKVGSAVGLSVTALDDMAREWNEGSGVHHE